MTRPGGDDIGGPVQQSSPQPAAVGAPPYRPIDGLLLRPDKSIGSDSKHLFHCVLSPLSLTPQALVQAQALAEQPKLALFFFFWVGEKRGVMNYEPRIGVRTLLGLLG